MGKTWIGIMTRTCFKKMQAPKPILLIPSTDCNSKLRAELKAAGYVVISTDNPANVKLLSCAAQTDDIMMAALLSITGPLSSGERATFVGSLHERLKLREAGKLC